MHKKGTSYRDGVFILTILKSSTGHHRLGISISSTKVPLASKRNRIKRLIREVFRLNKLKLKNGPYDIVVSIAKAPSYKINFSTVEERLQMLLSRAGAL